MEEAECMKVYDNSEREWIGTRQSSKFWQKVTKKKVKRNSLWDGLILIN